VKNLVTVISTVIENQVNASVEAKEGINTDFEDLLAQEDTNE
jgi:hypothetical protein